MGHSAPLSACPARIAIGACLESEWHDIEPYGGLAEMGVRKSFGAGRKILLSQVMWENLLLTALGGALGLLLAWLALYTGREWIFTVLDSWPGMVPEGVDVRVSGEMLFAPLVFLAALVLCVVLNLLSALIPAWYSLRKPIVNSLNEKR